MRLILMASIAVLAACGGDEAGRDPATAARAPIDRFSATAGHLLVRTSDNGLPAANAAIDYDARFATVGLGPAGQAITQYDFDVQPTAPAPIYVFFQPGRSAPMPDQLNVVSVIPGDPGYNDLWQEVMVQVPDDYVANSVTSYDEIVAAGFPLVPSRALVNCPVVPEGSVARKRMAGDYNGLHQGWYGGDIIQYFHFGERGLATDDAGQAPVSSIYVAYAINPDQPGGGPASGYLLDGGATRNVTATVPADDAYAPLWQVTAYDNAAASGVHDLASAQAAPVIATAPLIVNRPIVAIDER